jgi:hypothetical protein
MMELAGEFGLTQQAIGQVVQRQVSSHVRPGAVRREGRLRPVASAAADPPAAQAVQTLQAAQALLSGGANMWPSEEQLRQRWAADSWSVAQWNRGWHVKPSPFATVNPISVGSGSSPRESGSVEDGTKLVRPNQRPCHPHCNVTNSAIGSNALIGLVESVHSKFKSLM